MNSRLHRQRNNAFSLVELSIVLVILGLLVGGILAGQSLIHSSALRSIARDADRYSTATQAFRDKYMAIPGDMATATSFWGSVTTSGGTCPDSAGSGTQTCNGNGDGMLSVGYGNRFERYRYWQHLANAGLIDGQLSGAPGPVQGTYGLADVPNGNLPNSKFKNFTYGVSYVARESTPLYYYTAGAAHYMELAICCDSATKALTWVSGNMIVAADAWNIDTKIDDGQPDSGKVQIGRGFWSGCVTNQNPPTTYKLDQPQGMCDLFIGLGF